MVLQLRQSSTVQSSMTLLLESVSTPGYPMLFFDLISTVEFEFVTDFTQVDDVVFSTNPTSMCSFVLTPPRHLKSSTSSPTLSSSRTTSNIHQTLLTSPQNPRHPPPLPPLSDPPERPLAGRFNHPIRLLQPFYPTVIKSKTLPPTLRRPHYPHQTAQRRRPRDRHTPPQHPQPRFHTLLQR